MSKTIPWAMPYINDSEVSEVLDCIESTWVTMGERVERFENELSEYVGVDHAIAVNSGTAALDAALKAAGIGPGDEVIVPAMTYIATVNSVAYQHATPVLADIKPDTYNLDPAAAEENITEDTAAIMPIDYGGQCADYDAFRDIAEDHDLTLVADAAEALSAKQNGEMAGSLGDISITSFHAAKLMTSVEGGMVFTDDDELASTVRMVRNQGEDPDQKYRHPVIGHNYRMSDLHAAVGLAQFDRIDEITEKRAQIAAWYNKGLEDMDDRLGLPSVVEKNGHAWFLYSVLVENRDAVQDELSENGVSTRVTWPYPVHEQPAYADRYAGESYPVAERFAEGVLSLPMYHSMTEEDAEYVIEQLREAVTRHVEAPYAVA